MNALNGFRLVRRVAGPGTVFAVLACWALLGLIGPEDPLVLGSILLAALIAGFLCGEATARVRAARFAWTLPDLQRVILLQVMQVGGVLLAPSALLAIFIWGAGSVLGVLGAHWLVFSLGLLLGALDGRPLTMRGIPITMRGMPTIIGAWSLAIVFQLADEWKFRLVWQAGIVSLLLSGLVWWLFVRALKHRPLWQDVAETHILTATSSPSKESAVLRMARSRQSYSWTTWLRVALFESLEMGGAKRWWMPFLLGPPALLTLFLGCHLFADWFHSKSALFGREPSTLIAGAMSWLTLMILLPGLNVPRPHLRHPVSRATLARSTFAGSLLLTATCVVGILATFLLYCAGLSMLFDKLSLDALLPGLRILAVASLVAPILQWSSLTRRGDWGAARQALAVLTLIAVGSIANRVDGGSWQLLVWITTLVLVLYGFYWLSVRSYFRRASLL